MVIMVNKWQIRKVAVAAALASPGSDSRGRWNPPESNWSMSALIYFDLTKQGHVKQHSGEPLIINNDLSIIHKTFSGICGALPKPCLTRRLIGTRSLSPSNTHISTSLINTPRAHPKISLWQRRAQSSTCSSNRRVQMELQLLIEGVKWTAAC